MTTTHYNAYLQSASWQVKRNQTIQRDNYQCQICGKAHSFKNRLQVHHYTYERLGNERLDDLVALCKRCHKVADKERLTNPAKRYKHEKLERHKHN